MCETYDPLRQLLDVFNQARNRGQFCTLHLETRNGYQFANVSVQVPPKGSPTRNSQFPPMGSPTRNSTFTSSKSFQTADSNKSPKSPSTLRRDRKRLEKWKKKRNEILDASTKSSSNSNDSIYEDVGSDNSSQLFDPEDNSVKLDSKNFSLKEQDNEMKDPTLNQTKRTKLSDKDFQELLKKNDLLIEDLFKNTTYGASEKKVENEDNRIEETTFEDAAKWAMNQKKTI